MSKLTAITNKSFICIQHVDCGVHDLFIISFMDYIICMWCCIGISMAHRGWFTNCSICRLHLCTQRRQIPMDSKQPTTSLITEHRNTAGPIYREGLIDIKAWIHNHTYCIVWRVIPHSCPDFDDGLTHWGRDKMAAFFPDDILKWILLNENIWILLRISLKFVPKVQIDNIPALVQIMAWRRPGDKPLSEPMMVNLLTHICVTRPQWVNYPAVEVEHGWVITHHCFTLMKLLNLRGSETKYKNRTIRYHGDAVGKYSKMPSFLYDIYVRLQQPHTPQE